MFTRQDLSVLHTTKRKYTKQILTRLEDAGIPYDHYTARIKTNDSISNKLKRKGIRPTPENAMTQISDIIGIRIVTQYISDIYKIADILTKHFNVKERIDYISRPKKSGYRSLHCIITVPVINNNFIFPYGEDIDIEIQIRTMGMDFWSSIEHLLVYSRVKRGKPVPKTENAELVNAELLKYADEIFSIDMRLQALKKLL